jgi:predicted Fe-Mo cluster-binding NifX family protein
MRYALAAENGAIAGHFGHAPSFIVVEIENGTVVSRKEHPSPPHEPGKIPSFVKSLGADCVVVGGIGQKARDLFSALKIDQICGVNGALDDVIASLAAGTLSEGEIVCDHGHH